MSSMRCGSVVSGRERGGQGPSEEEVERSNERREGNALARNHRGHIVRARVRISNTDRPGNDHGDWQHPGIRTTWPSKGRSPSYPERLVVVALFPPFASKRIITTGHRTGAHLHSAPVREKGVSSSSSSSSSSPLSRNEAHFRRRAHSFEIEPRYDRGKGHHLVANGRINVSSYRGPGRGIGSTDAQVSE